MKIYGIVKVGPKGQIVIPAEAREEFGIKPGDKVVIFSPDLAKGFVVTSQDTFEKFVEQVQEIQFVLKKANIDLDN